MQPTACVEFLGILLMVGHSGYDGRLWGEGGDHWSNCCCVPLTFSSSIYTPLVSEGAGTNDRVNLVPHRRRKRQAYTLESGRLKKKVVPGLSPREQSLQTPPKTKGDRLRHDGVLNEGQLDKQLSRDTKLIPYHASCRNRHYEIDRESAKNTIPCIMSKPSPKI